LTQELDFMANIGESWSVEINYRPAWSYAERAVGWLNDISEQGQTEERYGAEAPFLAFLYSSLCLESVVMEFVVESGSSDITQEVSGVGSILGRWRKAAKLLQTGHDESTKSYRNICNLTKDMGAYGLLVRSRNHIVHPSIHTETAGESDHEVQNDSIERLVSDLKRSDFGLPSPTPVFPNIVKSQSGALWACRTMRELICELHQVCEIPINEQWQSTFAKI